MTRRDGTWRGRLTRLLTVVRREPTGATPPRDVRIQLESLPAPLRAIARAQVESGLLIEAELPWLTVGSEVEAELPEGTQKGRVHWFGVDVTRSGSARLRVFIDFAQAGTPSAEWKLEAGLPGLEDLRPRPTRWGAWLAFALVCAAGGFVGGWIAPHPPRPTVLPSVVESVPPRPPQTTVTPKALPEADTHAADAGTAPAPPPPSAASPPAAPPTKPRPRHRRK